MAWDAVAIVAAGGAARRLGSLAPGGKAPLVAGDRTFLDRVVSALATVVPRVIVVAAPGDAAPALQPGTEVIRDSTPRAGPLAAVRDGLVYALAAAAPPRLAVLCPCDVPLLVPGVIDLLLARASVPGARWALPVVGGQPQPLPSALAVDLLPIIEVVLAAGGGGFRDLAAAVGRADPHGIVPVGAEELRAVDPALDSFRDVDTPADLADVVRRAAARPREA